MRGIYRAFAAGLSRQPQVVTAMLADAFSRPDGAASRLIQRYFPRALHSVGGWLSAEMATGRIHRLPIPLLIQQLLGPLLLHLLSDPLLSTSVGLELPEVDEACTMFAAIFVRAVGRPETSSSARSAAETETTEGHR